MSENTAATTNHSTRNKVIGTYGPIAAAVLGLSLAGYQALPNRTTKEQEAPAMSKDTSGTLSVAEAREKAVGTEVKVRYKVAADFKTKGPLLLNSNKNYKASDNLTAVIFDSPYQKGWLVGKDLIITGEIGEYKGTKQLKVNHLEIK